MINDDDGCPFGQAVPEGKAGLVMTHHLGCEQFRFTPSDVMVIRCRSSMGIGSHADSAALTKIRNEGERDLRGRGPNGTMFQMASSFIRSIDFHDPSFLTARLRSV